MADPNLAPQPQPQPAPGVDPHPAPRPRPKPSAPASPVPSGPDAPTPIDAMRAARLVLRDAASTAAAAVAGDGPTRHAGLVEAAGRVRDSFRELVALSDLQPIAWHELIAQLSSTLVASRQLGGALRGAGIPAPDGELAASVARLEAKVAPADWAAATAGGSGVPMRALSSPEHSELARLAIAAAVKHSAAARAAATKRPSGSSKDDRDRDTLIRLLQPVLAHIATAIDAAAAMAAGPQREPLRPDVRILSTELEELAGNIEMTPKLDWDLSFARAFDSENQLRTLVGLPKEPRPYTGTIDPHAAVGLVKQGASPDPSGAPATGKLQDAVYTDPRAAVHGIAIQLSHTFDERIDAAGRLRSDLEEPPPPKERSFLEVLVEAATTVALSMVSSGLTMVIADKLRGALERSTRTAANAHVARTAPDLSESARGERVELRIKDDQPRRNAIVELAKDGIKRVFMESGTRALASARPSELNAARPLNAYTQHLEGVLRAARYEAALMMTHLSGALDQLDLALLDAFARSLGDVYKEANGRQYDVSLREWQNLRARLASPSIDPAAGDDPNLDAPRKNAWSEEQIPGVLEIGLEVDSGIGGPIVECKYLVLRDGEPAAIRHLKQHPRRLADAGLNRQYQLGFSGAGNSGWLATRPGASAWPDDHGLPTFVKVGVGVQHGFQPGSLKREELRLLKLFASRPVTGLGLWDAYLLKIYDRVPDAAAIALVKEIIAEVDDVTTSKLEGE